MYYNLWHSCSPYYGIHLLIVFDQDIRFMLSYFPSWAASKWIKLEPSTTYHPQMDGQSEIVNKEIMHSARACKAEGNKLLSKILEIQLKLNSCYNTSRRNNPFVIILGFDAKLELDIFPYPINNYQPAIERYEASSQPLTNAKVSQAKQVKLHHTLQPQHKVRDNVIVSTKNINIKNVLSKMKPLLIGLFTILSANYNCNNYSLDRSTDPSLNLIYNTSNISKIKTYVKNNVVQELQCQLAKTGTVLQERYEVRKVIEYRQAPRTSIPQYKVRYLGYSFEDDQEINVKDISTRILQDF